MTQRISEEDQRKRQAFRVLCLKHDITYKYSDDFSNYVAGSKSRKKILEMAKTMDPEVAGWIWDTVMRTKIREGNRQGWYWTDFLK
jgi:hypothetical protein